MARRIPCSRFAIVGLAALALITLHHVPLVARAQSVRWSVTLTDPPAGGVSSAAFVDDDFVVLRSGPSYEVGTYLELFSVATQKSVWTQPDPCPFQTNTSTTDDPSSTSDDVLAAYHLQRTGVSQLTYLCWVPGEVRGHVVSVNAANGNITSKTHVHSRGLSAPHKLFTVGSPSAGAYCAKTPVEVICVSLPQGAVWHLGFEGRGTWHQPPWVNEYNGTLAIQNLDMSTLSVYDLWTGAQRTNYTLPTASAAGSVAGRRYLVIQNTAVQPCTAVTLDMHLATLSAVVTLPGSDSASYNGQEAGATALMIGDGSEPELIVTLLNSAETNVLGWKVPATATSATNGKLLFNVRVGNGYSTIDSWAVSPGYVVLQLSNGYSSGGTTTVTLQVGDGKNVSTTVLSLAPTYLTSVQEQDGYFIAAGTYGYTMSTNSFGSAVTLFNSSTGQPLWTQAGTEVVGPDLMPLDTKSDCVMVAPSQGYVSPTRWGQVQCIGL